ncbi:hypothetical protein EON81_09090 [bacterium]|nr:MAG: hypothetical protein EON81_09090 [bacterium]
MTPLPISNVPPIDRNQDFTSKLRHAWPRILLATTIALVISYIRYDAQWKVPTISPVPFTILGVAISIFLGFRNNAAYNRFWEARTLWGTHINSSRSFARQVMTLVVSEDKSLRAFQEDVIMATIAYAHSFKNHLQGDDPLDGTEKLMLAQEIEWLKTQDNVPVAILHIIGRRLQFARDAGWIAGSATIVLEGTLTELTTVQGGCERIKNTPVPYTYTLLSRTIVTFFCLLLPFGILNDATWLTPIVTFLVSYAFCGLDALGDEITEPFGHGPTDLPLERYSATIETNLRQILSDKGLPEFRASHERPVISREHELFGTYF